MGRTSNRAKKQENEMQIEEARNKADKLSSEFSSFEDLSKASADQDNVLSDTSNSATFPETTPFRVVKEVAVDQRCSEIEAAEGIALLIQSGGSAEGAKGSNFVKINDSKIQLSSVRRALIALEGNNARVRKLGRTLGNYLFIIGKKYDVKANLASKLEQYYDVKLEGDEPYWASDCQEYNPDCPQKVRDLLTRHHNEYVKK